jgi:hypothetical protein
VTVCMGVLQGCVCVQVHACYSYLLRSLKYYNNITMLSDINPQLSHFGVFLRVQLNLPKIL